jgi:hypothetical protein
MDRDDLAAWTARIAREFKPRTWEDVTDDMLDKIAVCSAAARDQAQPIRVLLEPVQVHSFGADPVAAGAGGSWMQKINKFALRAGWHGVESWGCWSARPLAELEFATCLPVGHAVCLRLLLRAALPKKVGTVILRDLVSGRSVTEKIEAARAIWIALDTQVGADNKICIQIERADIRFRQVEAARPCFVGVEAIAYV